MNNHENIFKRKNKRKRSNIILILIFVAILILFLLALIYFYLPFFQKDKINSTGEIQIYYMGELMTQVGYEEDNVLYLPYTFIKENIDPEINWDEKGEYSIITTNNDVFHLPFGNTEGLLNLEPYSFTYPLIKYNDNIYLPNDPLYSYYNIEIEYNEGNSLFIIHDLRQPLLQGTVLKDTKIRMKPTYNASWTNEVSINSRVNIMKEVDGWFWIESDNGVVGYINKKYVEISDIKSSLINKEIYQPWNPIGQPIQFIWEYVNKYVKINTDNINDLTGIHVISPTWFSLEKDGLVVSVADKEYMNWAHNNGYQIWPLFSNSFDPDLTHEMLSDAELRIKVIKQILSYADLYQLDGINIDFENVYLKDKELLVQFIRELTPLLHERNRTISLDVTFNSLSENWSLFYDRKRLGEVVDYIIVMGYDEYWASSPVAGSVSSLPWVEKGIIRLLEEVPNDKVILAVPLYTRLWTEEIDGEGDVNVSSKTFTMDMATDWIKENNVIIKYDEKTQQNYAELAKDTITYKIWIEDDISMQKRIDLMNKYNLAGMAAWRRGFESKDYWKDISEYISKRK